MADSSSHRLDLRVGGKYRLGVPFVRWFGTECNYNAMDGPWSSIFWGLPPRIYSTLFTAPFPALGSAHLCYGRPESRDGEASSTQFQRIHAYLSALHKHRVADLVTPWKEPEDGAQELLSRPKPHAQNVGRTQ
jgi:hypothetical protein